MTVREEDIEVLKSIIREYFFLSQLTMTIAANVTMSRKRGNFYFQKAIGAYGILKIKLKSRNVILV